MCIRDRYTAEKAATVAKNALAVNLRLLRLLPHVVQGGPEPLHHECVKLFSEDAVVQLREARLAAHCFENIGLNFKVRRRARRQLYRHVV